MVTSSAFSYIVILSNPMVVNGRAPRQNPDEPEPYAPFASYQLPVTDEAPRFIAKRRAFVRLATVSGEHSV
jgi:hypothetical protein